jgi:hypothetical protein
MRRMDDFIKIEALNIHQMMKKSPPEQKKWKRKKHRGWKKKI